MKDGPGLLPVHPPVLEQAPVKALDPDGLGVISVGTAAFAVATVVLWFLRAGLAADGHLWFLWVSITGTGLGLVALVFGLASRRRRRHAQSIAADLARADDRGTDEGESA